MLCLKRLEKVRGFVAQVLASRCVLVALVLIALLSIGGRALAQPLDAGRQQVLPTVSVEVLTDFPLHIGAGIQLSLPYRLEVFSSLGYMPGAYLDTINAFSESVGWYDELTSELIAASLENSIVWRVALGWRPIPGSGWYIRGGYSLAALGGGLSGTEVVAAVTDRMPSPGDESRNFGVDARVHLLDVETGWRVFLADGWNLRFALGGAFTVNADVAIGPTWDVPRARAAAVAQLSDAGEDYLESVFHSYVHTVSFTVATGWSF